MLRKWIDTKRRKPTTRTPVICKWHALSFLDVGYITVCDGWFDLSGCGIHEPDQWMEVPALRTVQRDTKPGTCKDCAHWGYGDSPDPTENQICHKLHRHGSVLDVAYDRVYGMCTSPTFGCICFEKRVPKPKSKPKPKKRFFVDDDGDIGYGSNWFAVGKLCKSKQKRTTLERFCLWLNSVLGLNS